MCICTCTFFFSFYIPTATVGSGKRGICSDRSDLNTCRPVRMLSPVQTDTTLLANNSQHCWMSHVALVCTPSQGCALRKILLKGPQCSEPVKYRGPARGESHVAHLNFKTSRVCVWSRKVVSCRDFILRAVAFWAMLLVGIYLGRASIQGAQCMLHN